MLHLETLFAGLAGVLLVTLAVASPAAAQREAGPDDAAANVVLDPELAPPPPRMGPDRAAIGAGVLAFGASYLVTVAGTGLLAALGAVSIETLGLSFMPISGPWTTMVELLEPASRSDQGGLVLGAILLSGLQLGGFVTAIVGACEERPVPVEVLARAGGGELRLRGAF